MSCILFLSKLDTDKGYDLKLKQRIEYLASHHNIQEDIIVINLINRRVTLDATLDKYKPDHLVLIGGNSKNLEFQSRHKGLRKFASVHPYPVYAPVPDSKWLSKVTYQEEERITKIRVEWFDEFFVNSIVKQHEPPHITAEREYPRGIASVPKTVLAVSNPKPKPKEVTLDHRQRTLKF